MSLKSSSQFAGEEWPFGDAEEAHLPDGVVAFPRGALSGRIIGLSTPPKHPQSTPSKWIESDELIELSGVAGQVARRALKNRRWRGAELLVREVSGGRGRGGKAYQVHVDSLPADLRAKWYDAQGVDVNAPVKADGAARDGALAHDPGFERDRAEAKWRLSVIRNLLRMDRTARGHAISAMVAEGISDMDGCHMPVGRSTLYDWIKGYEAKGLMGLMRTRRSDTGTKRVQVTRAWESFFGELVDAAQVEAVADEITAHIRGLWAAGAPGWKVVAEHSTTKLLELSLALGVSQFAILPKGSPADSTRAKTQFGICCVNRRRCENEREYALLAIKSRDNAVYQDKYAPTIRRDYAALAPREIIVGDVHPVDVMMRRADGSTVYPKAISWFDPATNEIHMSFVLCEKGESVRREYVALSFEAMVQEWGLPKLLYLDNGSEYKWDDMMDGFTMLSKLAAGAHDDDAMAVFDLHSDRRVMERVRDARQTVLRSTPYNAKGKPGIEGAFGNIEQVFFSTIEGWTAGDRMNKKTHAKGRDPVAYPGDASDFLTSAAKALEWYHKRPQHGRLNGRSPNDALRAYIDAGWGMTVLSRPEVLALAFATTETRTVDRGAVHYKPRHGQPMRFYNDALLPLTGRKITLKVPAYDPQYVFCFDGDQLICIALPERSYHPLDIEGAREGSRRKRYLTRHIAEKRRHCALLSLSEEVERHVEHLPDAPTVPVAAQVNVAVLERMAQRQLEATRQIKQEKPRMLDQWGVSNDAFTADLGWDDDGENDE